MSNSTSLKALQTKRGELTKELDDAKQQQFEKASLVSSIQKKISALDHEIRSLKVKDLVISEHAILRYIERVLKLDIDNIKSTILNEQVRKHVDALGAGKFPHADGFKIVVKDRVVVTIED